MIHNKLSRILFTAVMVMGVWATGNATIPPGYYNSLEGKSGQALKDAVHNLTSQHTVFSYNSLWIYFAETDCRPEDKRKVWDMYSDNTYYFRGGTSGVSGMHKEHSLPKSWWGGYDETGEVSRATFDNGVTKVGSPKTGQGGGSSTVFEPDDRYKGDFARTYFYMACAYQHYYWKYTYMMNNNTWKTFNDWSIELLCRWARNDAVSDKEVDRNEAVQHSQNNRNPFIDIPQLFEYIWGNRQGEVFYLSDAGTSTDTTTYNGEPELISPTQGTVLDFGEVALGKSLDYCVYIKGQGLNNPLSVQLYRYDYEMFSIPVSTISRTMANSSEGYPLKITYTPTTTGEHMTRLLILDGGLVGSVGVELRARCVPVPSLTQLTALPASGINDNTYVANWSPANEEVDYYVITRTVYNKANGETITESFSTDDNSTTSYVFTDRHPDELHTYYVQSYRLGYMSNPSNVITIDASGITGIEADKPLLVLQTEGGILIKCSENVGHASIYNLSGQEVWHTDNLHDDTVIDLPRGIYLLKTATSRTAWKIAVK